jgi:hypothetical protein
MVFVANPRFLWITLLISGRERLQRLANQGFGWIARQKSRGAIAYESTA